MSAIAFTATAPAPWYTASTSDFLLIAMLMAWRTSRLSKGLRVTLSER